MRYWFRNMEQFRMTLVGDDDSEPVRSQGGILQALLFTSPLCRSRLASGREIHNSQCSLYGRARGRWALWAVSSDTRSRSLAKEDSVLTQEALRTYSGGGQGLLVPVPDLAGCYHRGVRMTRTVASVSSTRINRTFRGLLSPREDFDLSLRGTSSAFRGPDLIFICF